MRILYNNNEGLKILIPAIDADILLIAEKDVPANILFKIVNDSEIPSDRTYRNAWEYDITEANADGRGLAKEEFHAKYPELSHWAVQ
jgi:hypothetical protein